MRYGQNVIRIGSPGAGKSEATARSVVESHDAIVIIDPHPDSFAQKVLTHATGNILYENISDIQHTLGFELLAPSTHSDLRQRQQENTQRAEAFSAILLRRRNTDSMATTPLLEEWVMSALMLWLFQATSKPLTWLPSAFLPGTDECEALVKDCTLPDIRHKFQQLSQLHPKALRAEIGSASRLIAGVFRSPSFQERCRGGFDLGQFLQQSGKLIVEKGRGVGDDTFRVIAGAIILLVVAHAELRPTPHPTIRIIIDEATNAGLASRTELQGAAETNKWGLYWEFDVQRLDFPGSADDVLQLIQRKEWFRCEQYELARKAATDILAGLPPSELPRAQRLAAITDEIMNLAPGWRYVHDKLGSRKEYVPLLDHPLPNWPGLRANTLKEKLCQIYARPEYGVASTPSASASPNDTPSPPPSSPKSSSAAKRWGRRSRKPVDGSASSGDEDASA